MVSSKIIKEWGEALIVFGLGTCSVGLGVLLIVVIVELIS